MGAERVGGQTENRRQLPERRGVSTLARGKGTELPAAKTPPALSKTSRVRRMLDEYAILGLFPDGHVMELVRPELGRRCSPATVCWAVATVTWCAWPAGGAPPKATGGCGVPDHVGRARFDIPGRLAGPEGPAQRRTAAFRGRRGRPGVTARRHAERGGAKGVAAGAGPRQSPCSDGVAVMVAPRTGNSWYFRVHLRSAQAC